MQEMCHLIQAETELKINPVIPQSVLQSGGRQLQDQIKLRLPLI